MVCSSLSFLGLFHPKAAFEIHLSGAFPVTQPTQLFDELCPLGISERFLSQSELHNASLTRPTFRALIRAAIRNIKRRV
jgi:hypothetical protein